MKNVVFSITVPVLLCVGCASDTGFYVETEAVPVNGEVAENKIKVVSDGFANGVLVSAPNARGEEVSRTFDMPAALAVISPRPRSAVVGRWRCNVYFDSKSQCWGGCILNHGCFCEEYHFEENGSFSKWRVSKYDNMIMPSTEEKGRWEYRDGIIRIKREYGIMFMDTIVRSMSETCPGSMLKCRDIRGGESFDWKLQWHSDSEFTIAYPVASDNSGELLVGPFGTLMGVSGRCDEDGCFRSENAAIGDIVVAPLRFKKVVININEGT